MPRQPSTPSLFRPIATVVLMLAAAISRAAPTAGSIPAEAPTAPPPNTLSTNVLATNAPPPPPGFFVDDGAARSLSVAEERGIDIDSDAVQREQSLILSKQNTGSRDALFSGTNTFTERIDRWHDKSFRWLDNSIRTLDLRWSTGEAPYDPEISTFILSLLTRVGGRGNDGDFDAKARFRADLALPGIERRLHLVADNLDRDTLPGTDPMNKDNDFRLGVRSIWDSWLGERWDLGGGIRWRDNKPVGYVDLEWRWSAPLVGGNLRFVPRGFWYTDDGFGENSVFSWTSARDGHRPIWKFLTAQTAKETTSGLYLEETALLALPHHARGCGWLFAASIFPHIHDGGHTFIDDIALSATWRDALYRRWIYYTVTPQVDFAEEDSHDPAPSLRIGIEILFGCETSDIL